MAETRKKSENRQRQALKTFRMTEAEFTAFMGNCEAANLQPAEYFRETCCGTKGRRRRKPKTDHKIPAALLGHVMKNQGRMARLDNNVNQMAKAINQARLRNNNSEMTLILERHAETLETLISLYQDYLEASNEVRDALRQTLTQ